jgi:hypothetical protein
MQVKYLLYSIA